MRKFLTALLFFAVFVASALVVLPARWLIAVLPATWPVAVVDATGTVWNGSALIALGPPESRSTLPAPVRWQTRLQGGPHLSLTHPWLDGPLALRPSAGGLSVSARSLRLPAATLADFGAPFNTLRPDGDLQLRWPMLRIGGQLQNGTLLDLDWTNASTALSLLRPIGHYRVRLAGEGGQNLSIALSTVRGPLSMEGKGSWNPGAGLRFSGVARPEASAPPEVVAALQSTLSAVGRRSGNDSILQVGR